MNLIALILIESILHAMFFLTSRNIKNKQASFEHRSVSARYNFATERALMRGYLRMQTSGKNGPAKATLESAAT